MIDLCCFLCKNEKQSDPSVQNRLFKRLQWAWKIWMCILHEKIVTVHGKLVKYQNAWYLFESTHPDVFFNLSALLTCFINYNNKLLVYYYKYAPRHWCL